MKKISDIGYSIGPVSVEDIAEILPNQIGDM